MAKSAYAWAVTGALGVGACVLGVATLLDHGPADAIPRPAVTVGPSASTTGSPEPSRPTPSLSPSALPSATPTPTGKPSPTKSASPTRKPTKQVTTSASTAPSAVSAVSPASPVSAD